MTITKESKRILSVTVKREVDSDGDHSYLGEYSDTPNDYAIVQENARGEYGGQFVDQLPCAVCDHSREAHQENGDGFVSCDAEGVECECEDFDRVEIERGREYRYFNPPIENYEGETGADIRKYSLQDYERMRGLDRGDWCYVGVTAEAEVQLTGTLCQTITSGGLWGIESDSGDEYFTEIEGEELGQLRDQLHAIGFTKRAIVAAMRQVERKDC